MTNGGSGNIYSVVVDIPAKAVYEFKIIMITTGDQEKSLFQQFQKLNQLQMVDKTVIVGLTLIHQKMIQLFYLLFYLVEKHLLVKLHYVSQ